MCERDCAPSECRKLGRDGLGMDRGDDFFWCLLGRLARAVRASNMEPRACACDTSDNHAPNNYI
jgi:hypothetical protein